MPVRTARTRAALMDLTRTLARIDVERFLKEKEAEAQRAHEAEKKAAPRRRKR